MRELKNYQSKAVMQLLTLSKMYFVSSSFGQPIIVNELFCQLQVTGPVTDFPI